MSVTIICYGYPLRSYVIALCQGCYPLRRCVVEPLTGGRYAVAQLRRRSHLFPLCSFAVVRYLLHVIPYAVMPLTRYL